jgi:serine protease Do
MSTRKTTLFYMLLIAVSSFAVALVIASRLDMASQSSAQTFTAPPMNSAPLTGALDAQTFRNVAKAQSPMVVNIRTETTRRAQDLSDFYGGAPPDDLFRRFFGQPPGDQDQDQNPNQNPNQAPRRRQPPRDQTTVAAGTGFIISKDGLILTNNHVVEGATKIEVSLYGEDADQLYQAKLIGRDELTDSALIQLTEKPNHTLPEAKFGDSSQMAAGDWVMAIGNPFGLAHTVSVGVISALERPFPTTEGRSTQVLQTDAAINPGNSGGPLLNIRGEVIGINSAIYTDARQAGNIGIGFAIPINTVRELLPQLRGGKITRGMIGVSIGVIPQNALETLGMKNRQGALVASVAPGGPASKAGLEPGDVIVQFNSRPVKDRDSLVSMVVSTTPNTTVPVKVIRDREEKTLNVRVGELDLDAEQAARNTGGRGGAEPQQEASSGFGMSLSNITPDVQRRLRLDDAVKGAVVVDVEPSSPAARAGITAGDVITRVGRAPIGSVADASRELARIPSGGTAILRVVRNGQDTAVVVTKE